MSTEILNKKCGIIAVTIKRNGKAVYSFNCLFCDIIFMQMKKFTQHLEQVHEQHLGKYHEKRKYADLTPEIEIEESCFKSDVDEPHVFPLSSQQTEKTCHQDPLDMAVKEENLNTQSMDVDTENDELNLDHKTVANYTDNDVKAFSVQTELGADADNDNVQSSDGEHDSFSSSEHSEDETFLKPLANEVIVALLETFKNYPLFWATPHTTKYNLNEKPQLLQTMTAKLNENLTFTLKDNTVKKTLISLCQQYEQHVVSELQHSSNEKEESSEVTLWFFEHMEFMKNSIAYRFKHKKPPKPKLKPLSNDLICDIIEIYKNFSSLWDVQNLAYPIKEKRKEALQSMVSEIYTKMHLTLNVFKLSDHLKHIHTQYSKDKRIRLECENTKQLFKPSGIFYDKCEFLDKHIGPFRCFTCKKIIEKENDFRTHKASHDGSMPFICPDCGMGFKKKSYYSTHVKRHLGFFKFHCEICGKGYPFNAELDEHMRSHTGALPFLCSICGEGFGRASTYDNHIRRHEERFKYFCEICKKGFNCLTRHKDHVKGHLNVRDCICGVCGKSFTSRRYLSQHKRIHATKDLICNICGRGFGNQIGLRSHKKYHENGSVIKGVKSKLNK